MSNDRFFTGRISRSYEGAGQGRRISSWRANNAGPNNAVADSLETLRNRSRDAIRNSSIAAAVIRCWVNSLLGFGLTARPKTTDKGVKAKLTDLWSAWCASADADGGDFAGLQQVAVRAWLEAGECFIRARFRRPEDGLPVPLQIQLLESDMVPTLDVDVYPGLPAGNVIRQGIELDPIGRRVAYWVYRAHPGDTPPPRVNASELVRIPAKQVFHLYEPLRPGQLRGVPILAPVITRLRNIDDFDDAVLERQKIANLFTLFITKALPSNSDALTGLPIEGTPDAPIASLEPGLIQELLPGDDVKFSEPPGSGVEYDQYIRRQLMTLSAGVGLPFELAFGDVKDISDRSLRLTITDFRRACEAKLWGVIVPRAMNPIRRAWAMAGFLGGQLTAAETDAALRVNWAPPAWPQLHPLQDIQAQQLQVEQGFRSRSSVIAEYGEDPTAVDEERAADWEREDRLGIVDTNALEAEKLQVEIEQMRKQGQAADATTNRMRAEQATLDAVREHAVLEARNKAATSKLEVEAARVGLAELKGEATWKP